MRGEDARGARHAHGLLRVPPPALSGRANIQRVAQARREVDPAWNPRRSAVAALAAAGAWPLPALAQAPVATADAGWPFEWIVFTFSCLALVAALAFVAAAVRWRAPRA